MWFESTKLPEKRTASRLQFRFALQTAVLPGYSAHMNRLFLLIPLTIVAGCEFRDATTPVTRSTGSPTRISRRDTAGPAITTEVARTDQRHDPARKSDPKDSLPRPPEMEEPKEEPPELAPPIPESFKVLNKDKKNLFFEVMKDGSRRVHLLAEVCLREGPLEVLLCKMNTKEHESILHIDADGREIHFALEAAGAKAGSPVKFVPKYAEASGSRIKISLTYREKGKVKTVPAGEWIKDKKTGKDMAYDWVFAGSKLFKDPERPDATPFYMANNGEFISLANFPDSMLDLPVKSPKDIADLIFEINTSRIPPIRTPVIVTLEPVVEKKK